MKKIVALGLACAALTIFVTQTDPSSVPSFVLIIPFVLLFVVLFLFSWLVCAKRGWARAKSVRTSAVLAGLPVAFLILQSVGQLTARDIISILAIFVIAYFYVTRAMAAG